MNKTLALINQLLHHEDDNFEIKNFLETEGSEIFILQMFLVKCLTSYNKQLHSKYLSNIIDNGFDDSILFNKSFIKNIVINSNFSQQEKDLIIIYIEICFGNTDSSFVDQLINI